LGRAYPSTAGAAEEVNVDADTPLMFHSGREEGVIEIKEPIFLKRPRPYYRGWQSIVRESLLFLHLASPEMASVVVFERIHYIPCRSFIQYEASPERRRRGAAGHGRRDGAVDQKQG
jgi:hypothetical protein